MELEYQNSNPPEEITYSKYFNIWQYRIDLWNHLLQESKHLQDNPEDKAVGQKVAELLDLLGVIERYWGYPGMEALRALQSMYNRHEYISCKIAVSNIFRALTSESYRHNPLSAKDNIHSILNKGSVGKNNDDQHYFEVLIADNLSKEEESLLKERFSEVQTPSDKFIYNVVAVNSLQDALIALLFNTNIQSCLIREDTPFSSKIRLESVEPFLSYIPDYFEINGEENKDLGPLFGGLLKSFRPEIDLFYITTTSINRIAPHALQLFRRIFYRQEDIQELHLSILRSIQNRYRTPFLSALMEYSKQPTGVFHAMPISRGNSVFKSHWIKDIGKFYGRNIFLAETSATTGGLDSLLQPKGSIKEAQKYAARAFGAKQTFFVTNGTSTSNKIVMQALVKPNDIVLVDRDCHKSHHYALLMIGAHPVYLDSYPIEEYSMYGAVPLQEIKNKLLEFRDAGRLDKVKMLVLTNCTFDGVVYNTEKVMEEILAIKPDMIFLWDEAWFGFAAFTPNYRQRTAMSAAKKLEKKYHHPNYLQIYKKHAERAASKGIEITLPDPEKVRIRVYSTQSTHKTLTSFRQGSMIHIYDEDFKRKTEDAFHESYMTHISTSPNYQIIATLDAGRRQVEFEGYELVERSIEMAMRLREKITMDELLRKYFEVLTIKDFIPGEYRSSGLAHYFDPQEGWSNMTEAWQSDEFVLDPTKITLYIGRTGIDGDTFKREFLMDQFGIQINKTTRNTVLFMTNIGTTRSSISYLVSVLQKVAQLIEDRIKSLNSAEKAIHDQAVHSLTENLPPLPNFSFFHPAFRPNWETPEGNIRKAFFFAYDEELCEFLKIEECEKAIQNERHVVSTNFVTPYPPGFPVLVPGQVITKEILDFMKALDVTEIHSYRPELGFRVFKEIALEKLGYERTKRKKENAETSLVEKKTLPLESGRNGEKTKKS